MYRTLLYAFYWSILLITEMNGNIECLFRTFWAERFQNVDHLEVLKSFLFQLLHKCSKGVETKWFSFNMKFFQIIDLE